MYLQRSLEVIGSGTVLCSTNDPEIDRSVPPYVDDLLVLLHTVLACIKGEGEFAPPHSRTYSLGDVVDPKICPSPVVWLP